MRAAIAILLVILVILGATGGAVRYFWSTPPAPFAESRMVTVEKGESFQQVARALKAAGVIRSALLFHLYGSFTGDARTVKPGDYAFRGGEPMVEVLRHLVRGDFVVITITIPEGLTLHEIAERVGRSGLVCPDDFEREARGGALVRALGLIPFGAEGYLFPATYKFSPRANVNDVLFAMLSRFYQVMTPKVEAQLFNMGLTTRQMVTMASMVEKEAKVPGERPLIAGVFYNRLKQGIPLQSDPTAEYSLDGDDAPASVAVRMPSAYNTYVIAGLPPGPIANPGLRSIDAALYPAQTEFLYFVARDDGTHVFSKTLKQHNQAIASVRKLTHADGDAKASNGRHSE